MRKDIKTFVILSLCLFLGPLKCFAASTPAQQLQKVLSSINTITADFQQKLYDENKQVLQSSKGYMAILRPGKFLWQIDSPNNQLIIADGKDLWIYDKDLKQVVVEKIQKGIGTTPAALLSGSSKDILNKFEVQKNGNLFILKSKEKDSLFQSISLNFQGNKLTMMQLTDNLGQESILNFSSIKVNLHLNKSTFSFSPPKGVEVIKNASK